MANSNHTPNRTVPPTLDFVFVTDAVLARYSAAAQRASATITAQAPVPSFDLESLRQFHEEFKALVLAANQEYIEQEEMAWEDTVLKAPVDADEIQWLQ